MPRHSPRQAQANGQRPQRRYASIRATAEMLGVDHKTVRRWISRGLITGYRVGTREVRVHLNEVEDRVVQVIPGCTQTCSAFRLPRSPARGSPPTPGRRGAERVSKRLWLSCT